jgi:hypothetical protein
MVYYTMPDEKIFEFRFEIENFSFLRFHPLVPPPVVADFSQYRDLKYERQGEKITGLCFDFFSKSQHLKFVSLE